MEGELKIGMRTHFAAQIRGLRLRDVGNGVAIPEILAEIEKRTVLQLRGD